MIRIERLEDTLLIWVTSVGSLYKDLEITIILLIVCLLSHFIPSTSIPSLALEATSLEIPAYTEDQLRYSALCAKYYYF